MAEPLMISTRFAGLDDLARKARSSGAKTLLLSHMRGHICDMQALTAVCAEFGIRLHSLSHAGEAMLPVEREDFLGAGQLQDGRQVGDPAGMGGAGLGVEAQDTFLGEVLHGPFGVLFALDDLRVAIPLADG